MNDQELIQLYLGGKDEMLDLLLEKHVDKIFSACYRVCLDEQDANDVMQTVLIKIIRYLPKFKQESNFTTWYYRISYNESITFLKKQKQIASIDGYQEVLPSDDDIPMSIIQENRSKHVTQIINTLPNIERNIVLYYYYDNLKIKEIAEIMNLNENTIKTKLSRSKKILSPQLTQYETLD